MFTTLAFTTLFASIAAVSGALTVKTPTDLVQCTNTTLGWEGGVGPYTVDVFTDCQDERDDPIASFADVAGTQVTWYITEISGSGLFVQVTDSKGEEAFSKDAYVGGDAGAKADACAAAVSSISTASTATATSTAGSVPTTMSGANRVNGVANAAAGPTNSAPVVTGTPLGTPNGAASLSARPVQIGAGFLAAIFAAAML